ncbi:membrane protein [Mycobacterium phage Eaglepride]|nr:membrane protein [Mycobacterium phage Eaglepride]
MDADIMVAMRRTRRHRRTAWAAVGIALAGFAGTGVANAEGTDPFDQRSFPCAEDEVLGYAPEFGPDRVGCIHIESLR